MRRLGIRIPPSAPAESRHSSSSGCCVSRRRPEIADRVCGRCCAACCPGGAPWLLSKAESGCEVLPPEAHRPSGRASVPKRPRGCDVGSVSRPLPHWRLAPGARVLVPAGVARTPTTLRYRAAPRRACEHGWRADHRGRPRYRHATRVRGTVRVPTVSHAVALRRPRRHVALLVSAMCPIGTVCAHDQRYIPGNVSWLRV